MTQVPITITVAPEPAGWQSSYNCGCNTEGRCARHRIMVRHIHTAVWHAEPGGTEAFADLFERVWAESNGYGAPGTVPSQGYDWSGIRDSTPSAIERMYAIAAEAIPQLCAHCNEPITADQPGTELYEQRVGGPFPTYVGIAHADPCADLALAEGARMGLDLKRDGEPW